MNKESLRRLTVEELRGQLAAAKESYAMATSQLGIENQLNKLKTLRGKGSTLKKGIIEQILRIERDTQAIQTKVQRESLKANLPFDDEYVTFGKIKVKGQMKDFTSSEMWAAIKVYKDNVKRGAIKEKNDFENLYSEEQAEYAFHIMERNDFFKYIKLENEKAADLEAKVQDAIKAREANIKRLGGIWGF